MTIRYSAIFSTLTIVAGLYATSAIADQPDREAPKLKRVCVARVDYGSVANGRRCRMVPANISAADEARIRNGDARATGQRPQVKDFEVPDFQVATPFLTESVSTAR